MKKILFITMLVYSSAFLVDKPASYKVLIGTGSYYAKKFEGRKTASGEVFRHSGFTAASNFYPLHTKIKVTNLETGDTIIVTINDRMAKRMASIGRVVDLTKAGADSLKYFGKGLQKVSIQQIL